MHALDIARLRFIAMVRSRFERMTSYQVKALGDDVVATSASCGGTKSDLPQHAVNKTSSLLPLHEQHANADEVMRHVADEHTQPGAELVDKSNPERSH